MLNLDYKPLVNDFYFAGNTTEFYLYSAGEDNVGVIEKGKIKKKALESRLFEELVESLERQTKELAKIDQDYGVLSDLAKGKILEYAPQKEVYPIFEGATKILKLLHFEGQQEALRQACESLIPYSYGNKKIGELYGAMVSFENVLNSIIEQYEHLGPKLYNEEVIPSRFGEQPPDYSMLKLGEFGSKFNQVLEFVQKPEVRYEIERRAKMRLEKI
ncbi:MAG: hypothetical protein AABW92_02105 [Nanoarchaeota archaeon]|mgnify:CR=1 FL=1